MKEYKDGPVIRRVSKKVMQDPKKMAEFIDSIIREDYEKREQEKKDDNA